MQVTLPDGQVVEISDEELKSAGVQEPVETEVRGLDRVTGAIKQLGSGAALSLFALPDAVSRKYGEALGLSPEESFQFAKYFDVGKPRDSFERFTRALGEGAGAAIPFTGALGQIAKTKALTSIPTDAGALKKFAKSVLDFYRKDPAKAAALDIGSSAAFTGVLQQLEERAPGGGMAGDVTRFLTAAVAPVAAGKLGSVVGALPSVRVARAALAPTGDQAVTGPLGKMLGIEGRVQKEVAKQFEPITPGSPSLRPEAAAELLTTESVESAMTATLRRHFDDLQKSGIDIQSLPREEQMLFQRLQSGEPVIALTPQQRAMYAELLDQTQDVIQRLPPELKNQFVDTYNANKRALEIFARETFPGNAELQQKLASAFQKEIDIFDSITKVGLPNLTAEEAARVRSILSLDNPVDPNLLGDGLRRGLEARLKASQELVETARKDLGLREGLVTTGRDEGLRKATIQYRNGIPVPTMPAIDAGGFTREFIDTFFGEEAKRIFGNTMMPKAVNDLRTRWAQYNEKIAELAKRPAKLVGEEPSSFMLDVDLTGGGQMRVNLLTQQDSTLKQYLKNGQISQDKFDEVVAAKAKKAAGEEPKAAPAPTTAPAAMTVEQLKEMFPFQLTFPDLQDLTMATRRTLDRAEQRMAKVMSERGTPGYETANQAVIRARAMYDRADDMLDAFESQMTTASGTRLADLRERQNKLVQLGLRTKEEADAAIKMQGEAATQYEGIADRFRRYMELVDQEINNKALSPAISKVLQKGPGGAYLIPNEKVASAILDSVEALQAAKRSFGPENTMFNGLMRKAVIDKLINTKGVVNPTTGVFSPRGLEDFLRKNQGLINELDDTTKALLQDQKKLSDSYVARRAELVERANAVKEDKGRAAFMKAIEKYVDPNADIDDLLLRTIRDPALMGKVAGRLDDTGKDALRAELLRMLSDVSLTTRGGAIRKLINDHRRSFEIAFDRDHLNNLYTVLDAAERIGSVVPVTGRAPNINSLDEKFRRIFGSGLRTIESQYRIMQTMGVNPRNVAVGFFVRMYNAASQGAFDRAMMLAAVDPNFAKGLAQMSTSSNPIGVLRGLGKGFQNQLLDVGFNVGKLYAVDQATAFNEVAEKIARQPSPSLRAGIPSEPQEVVIPEESPYSLIPPRTTDQGPRAMPAPAPRPAPQAPMPAPAPQSSLANVNIAAAPAQPAGQTRQQYAALFPYDPISPLMRS